MSFDRMDCTLPISLSLVQDKTRGDCVDFRTADLSDAHPQDARVCEIAFQSYGGVSRFCGPIATVRVYEDNVLVKRALQTIAPGSVLVVDGGGSTRYALVGGNLAAIAAERNLAGIVVYGAVRDVLELAVQPVGVFALGTHPRKSRKLGEGAANEPVQFGSVEFVPGHYLYADEDGLLVASKALIG